MHPESLARRAAELAAKTFEVQEPLILDRAEAHDPKSGKRIHRFKTAPATHANGPASMVYVDEYGEHVEVTHEIAGIFERPAISPVVSPVNPVCLDYH